jgi:CRISPR locus-related DNA-binding protein
MPNKALVFTLGFDVTHVLTRLTEVKLTGTENLIFILPSTKADRAEASISAIQSHVSALNSRGFKLSCEFLRIDEHNFISSVNKLFKRLTKFDEIQVELSGGLRILNLALLSATLLLRKKVTKVNTKLETDGSNVDLTLMPVRPLKDNEKKLLSVLKGSEKSVIEIAQLLNKNKTSVYRVLKGLEAYGLVCSNGNYPVKYKTTTLGELFLNSQNQETE